MTDTYAPFGFRPLRRVDGAQWSHAFLGSVPVASAYGTSLFKGDPVIINAGNVEAYVTVTDDIPFGIFMGVSYTQDGEPKWSKRWVASTSASDIKAIVAPLDGVVFLAQADASISAGDVWAYSFDVTLGTGSAVTGLSGAGVEEGTRASDGMVKVVGIYDSPDNAAGDAYTLVEVIFQERVNAYTSVATSAG